MNHEAAAKVNNQANNQVNGSITANDERNVQSLTANFLDSFQEGKPLDNQDFVNITMDYFSKDFLENDFNSPAIQEDLFGVLGYGQLTRLKIDTYDNKIFGAVKGYEITDIQKDNKNQTLTTYIRFDKASELNDKEWIEWRKIPGEGWKVHALSLNGNIDSLNKPLSPKKQL
jgi:hypothetical protein